MTTVEDNGGNKEKKRAGNEYPRHNVWAGGAADNKDLASDDQCTSNHDQNDSGPVGKSYGSAHDRNCTPPDCDVASHAPNKLIVCENRSRLRTGHRIMLSP